MKEEEERERRRRKNEKGALSMVENFACNFLLSLEALASSPLPLLISGQTGLSKSKTKLILKRKWLLSGFLMSPTMFFLSSASLQFSFELFS